MTQPAPSAKDKASASLNAAYAPQKRPSKVEIRRNQAGALTADEAVEWEKNCLRAQAEEASRLGRPEAVELRRAAQEAEFLASANRQNRVLTRAEKQLAAAGAAGQKE